MVQGAVYDAVNAIDRGHQPYLLDVDDVGAQPFASQDAAVATAAHHVLVAIVAPARVRGLDTAYAATLAAIPDGASEGRGVDAGEAAATAMLDGPRGDGYMAAFTPSSAPTRATGGRSAGRPRRLDPDGWVGNLKPFVIESPSQFRSKGPERAHERGYTKDFNEVKYLGALNSTTRTADQTTAAIFWQFAPAPLWNRLARDLAAPGINLDTDKQARLLRDGQPRRRRRRDRLLERQVPLGLLAAEGGDPRGRQRRQPGDDRRPRLGVAVQPRDTDDPPLATPPFPDHPRATAA